MRPPRRQVIQTSPSGVAEAAEERVEGTKYTRGSTVANVSTTFWPAFGTAYLRRADFVERHKDDRLREERNGKVFSFLTERETSDTREAQLREKRKEA